MKPPCSVLLCLFALALIMDVFVSSGCSRRPMQPTRVDAERFTALMEAAGQKLTTKEQLESRLSDDGNRRVVVKLLVDPFAETGCDLDATLADFATRLRDGNLTQDETQVAILVLYIFQDKVADLARWRFTSNETRDLVRSVHGKIQ